MFIWADLMKYTTKNTHQKLVVEAKTIKSSFSQLANDDRTTSFGRLINVHRRSASCADWACNTKALQQAHGVWR